MSYLDRIKTCNGYELSGFRPLLSDGVCVGWVQHEFAEVLALHADCFLVTSETVGFSDHLNSAKKRTEAIAHLAPSWVADGLCPALCDEIYPVRRSWASPEHFQVDRSLVALFGIRAYGVHLNGFVRKAGQIHLWIGRRAADRQVEPNKLDNIVAGGQPAGLSLMENLVKECDEEAKLPYSLASKALSTGTVSYCFESSYGLKSDTLFCYDLAVPEGFTPENQDGEISDFELMPIETVLSIVRDSSNFKFNVSLVILDFAIRHGVISPDSEPDFEDILAGLHAGGPKHDAAQQKNAS